MFTLVVIATVASVLWTAFIIVGNGMAYGSDHVFEAWWLIGGAWLVTGVLYTAALLG